MSEESIATQLEWRDEQAKEVTVHYGREVGQIPRYTIGPWNTGFYVSYLGVDDDLEQDENGSYIGGRYDTLDAAKAACQRHHDKMHNRVSVAFSEGLGRIRLVRGLFCTCGYELQAKDIERRDDYDTRLICAQCRRDILIMD
jgi:hypothetical protein